MSNQQTFVLQETEIDALELIADAFTWLEANTIVSKIPVEGSEATKDYLEVRAEDLLDLVLHNVAISAAREVRAQDPGAKLPEAFVSTYRRTNHAVQVGRKLVGRQAVDEGLEALRTALQEARALQPVRA